MPSRLRRSLRQLLHGAGDDVGVLRYEHDRRMPIAADVESRGGGRPDAEHHDRAVQDRRPGGRREAKPRLAAWIMPCESHFPLIGVGRTAYNPLARELLPKDSAQLAAATISAERLANLSRNSARSVFSRSTCARYSSARAVRS